jgi:hypothetical protein
MRNGWLNEGAATVNTNNTKTLPLLSIQDWDTYDPDKASGSPELSTIHTESNIASS